MVPLSDVKPWTELRPMEWMRTVEVAVVLHLLAVRSYSTTEVAGVPLMSFMFIIPSNIADESLPDDIRSVGMVNESRREDG